MSISRLLLSTACVCLLLVSCKQFNRNNAINFNNKIEKVNQTIAAYASKWRNNYVDCKRTGDYYKLGEPRERMEKYIEKQTKTIKQIELAGKGGIRFKNEELAFLKLEHDIISFGISRLEGLNAKSTEEEKQYIINIIADMAEKEEAELKQLDKIQVQYARDNDFELRKVLLQ